MKVKLDDFGLRALINGLFRQRTDYDTETNAVIGDLLLRLAEISDTMKPNRKKKIPFEPEEPEEVSIIRKCLVEWRNREIQAGRQGAVDGINELLLLFAR